MLGEDDAAKVRLDRLDDGISVEREVGSAGVDGAVSVSPAFFLMAGLSTKPASPRNAQVRQVFRLTCFCLWV